MKSALGGFRIPSKARNFLKMFIDKLEPGRYYHIFNRGINRTRIFQEERNYYFFLERFSKYLDDKVDVYAYCLMPTHFHFFVYVLSEIQREDQISLTSVRIKQEAPEKNTTAITFVLKLLSFLWNCCNILKKCLFKLCVHFHSKVSTTAS